MRLEFFEPRAEPSPDFSRAEHELKNRQITLPKSHEWKNWTWLSAKLYCFGIIIRSHVLNLPKLIANRLHQGAGVLKVKLNLLRKLMSRAPQRAQKQKYTSRAEPGLTVKLRAEPQVVRAEPH